MPLVASPPALVVPAVPAEPPALLLKPAAPPVLSTGRPSFSQAENPKAMIANTKPIRGTRMSAN
jgi:hypothetical protein